jgi:hypothetical protein
MAKKLSSSTSVTEIARRNFVRGVMATAATPLLSSSVFSACQGGKATVQRQKTETALDQALDLIFSTGRDHRGSSHVPMVAETLIALGRPDVVLPWVERNYLNSGDGKSPQDFQRQKDLSNQNWRAALGEENRRADWVDFFTRQIGESNWKSALKEWVPRLTPGIAAFAAHGVIRTAHAVRSLEASEAGQRKRELAEGLGLWAATYQPLPEAPATKRGTLKPSEAIRQLEHIPLELIRRGNIVMALSSLEDFPPFASAINRVDTTIETSRFLADLTETFAAVYLANARDFASMITLVHAVTGASAIRLLLPYVNTETKTSLLRYGWQLAAGIYAIRGRTAPGEGPKTTPPGKEELIERAVKNGNSHPIKFTEACLREYALNPKPVYLIAALHATENMRG